MQTCFSSKKPVLYSATSQLDAQLDRLGQLGVLGKDTYSAWTAPIVTLKVTNGAALVCGDLSTGLNDVIQTHQ